MNAATAELPDFLGFSSVLTGFSVFQLQGTGQAASYLSTVIQIVGEATVVDLLQAFRRVREKAGDDEAALDRLLRADILSDDRLGPIARNVIKLWFVGYLVSAAAGVARDIR